MYSRVMLVNNSKKWTHILIATAFFWGWLVIGFNDAFAEDRTNLRDLNHRSEGHTGIVGDLDSYSFTLSQSESLLIEVTQANADLKLVLFNTEVSPQNKPIFEASIPARKWISERILISVNQCTSCLLQIQPVENADKSGHYRLTSRRLSQDTHAAEIKFESMMTSASIQWLIAGEDENHLTQVADIYLKAAQLADSFISEQAKQRSLYHAAQVFHLLDKYENQKALLLNVTSLNVNPDSLFQLHATFDLGDIMRGQKQYKQSISYFERTKQLAKSHNNEMMHAKSNSRLGLIASGKGNYQAAVNYFEKAYSIFLASGDWRSTIEGLINLGWSNYRLGNLDLALNYYHQALSFATKAELPRLQVDAFTKIGTVYSRLGDIDQALHFIDQALVNSSKFTHSLLDGRAKQAKAKVLLSAGMFELAKDVFEEARAAYSKVNSNSDEIDIHYSLGKVHNELGNYLKAEEFYRTVLEYDKQTGNHYDVGTGYNRLAETAFEQMDYAKALDYQQQALEYLKDTDDEHLKGRLYSQTAIVYHHNGLKKASEDCFLRAMEIQKRSKDYCGLIDTGYRIATAEASKGNKNRAIETLTGIIDQIQLQGKNITRADLRRNFLALQQEIAGLQIRLMRDTHVDAAETLKLSEMFRSQTLIERLQRLGINKTVPPKLIKQRTQLQKELQSQVTSYHQLSDFTRRESIIKNTRKLASELQKLESSIRRNIKMFEPETLQPININQVQNNMDAESLVLYFDTSRAESFLWAVSSRKIDSFSLPSDEILTDQIKGVLESVRESPNKGPINRRKKQSKAINLLSNTLFAGKEIDWDKYNKFIVIPDGPINYLPLSMLKLPGTNRQLIENKHITYAASLGVLNQINTRNKIPGRIQKKDMLSEILLVANPKMLAGEESGHTVANLRSGFETSELPYTQKEADAIIKLAQHNTSILIRENANKQELLATPLENYQILHFATHGLANSELPSLGGIVLSNAKSDNNLLLAPEIINLNINAELVVLSGCETALGRLVNGEGLQGLSRAFFEAGAKRVIASLWSVQDDATAELMGAFYRFLLADKKRPGEALRLAKLHVKNYQRKNHRKPWKDPFYWAGFILQGTEESWID